MEAKQSCGGLDRFRIIAALLVAAIHTSPLLSFSADADFFLTRILARTAVPFFLMATGQFVVSEILKAPERASGRVWKYIKKTAILYGIAILIYIPPGIYAGHYRGLNVGGAVRMLVFDGTFYHLWYFPACITGVLLVFLLSKVMGIRGMTGVAAVLYAAGLLGDSYFGLLRAGSALYDIYARGFQVFSYTRNGLFMAPVFLLMGAEIGTGRPSASRYADYAGLAVSGLAMTAEAFMLRYFDFQRHDSMYIALIPTMVFLYRALLTWNVRPVKFLRSTAAWIYILHPAMIIVVRIAAKIFHMTELLVDNSLIHYLAVALVSVLAAVYIAKLMEVKKR